MPLTENPSTTHWAQVIENNPLAKLRGYPGTLLGELDAILESPEPAEHELARALEIAAIFRFTGEHLAERHRLYRKYALSDLNLSEDR